jgi:hypothetical protein
MALVASAIAPILSMHGSVAYGKQHEGQDQATTQLFQVLDASRDGKLTEFYILGDFFKDPSKPDEEYRHVLRVEYNKNNAFGKLKICVRTVGKMTDEQLRAYSPKQIYDFGDSDSEKFVKTTCGQFGVTGDLYLRAGDDSPLTTAPVTDNVRKEYEVLVTQYVTPALEKK